MRNLPARFSKSMEVILARADGPEFTLLDRKVFNVLYANAYRRLRANPQDRSPHRIQLNDLARAVMQHDGDLRSVRQSLERLWSVKIDVDYEDFEGTARKLRCHYLSYTTTKMEGGELEYCFDELLLQFIAHKKVYSLIEVDVSSAMTSIYGSKLYEAMSLVIRRLDPRWNPTLDEIREYFEVGATKYDRFDNLKRNVIDKAIEDVNRHAPFTVEAEYLRSGRGGKVTGVTFRASPKRVDDFLIPAKTEKTRSDLHTIDMFNGMTTADMLVPPELRSDTLAEATRMMGKDADLEELRDKWFGIYGARVHSNPDEMFLSWLKVHKEKTESHELAGLEIEALLEDYFK